jgi:quercetin dioxygenase-like cupin family protein
MKKLILITLLGTLLYSCNQDNKSGSQEVENVSKDTANVNQKAIETIDIVQTSPNQARVLMENEHVRVVEYFVKPGDKDVWHTHPPRSSYIVEGGKVKVYTENAEPKISEVKAGTSSWADRGAKHYVENVGSTDIKIILTEIKSLD